MSYLVLEFRNEQLKEVNRLLSKKTQAEASDRGPVVRGFASAEGAGARRWGAAKEPRGRWLSNITLKSITLNQMQYFKRFDILKNIDQY